MVASDPPAIRLFEDAVAVAKAELLAMQDEEEEEGASESSSSSSTTTSTLEERYDSSTGVVSSLVANYLCNDLYALIKKSAIEGLSRSGSGEDDVEEKRAALLNSISVEQSTVNGKRLGLLIALIVNGKLTTSMAKKILTIMYNEDLTSSPSDIATANRWEVISNMDQLTKLCETVIYNPKNTQQLEQYKLGGKNIWKIEKFFVGKVMAQSNGNAHPEKMRKALSCVLEKAVSG